MPKPKLQVNKDELSETIKRLEEENGGPFENRNVLHQAVAQTEWAKSHEKPLTPSVVMLRIQEYGLEPQTPKGKRGRKKGEGPPAAKKTSKKRISNDAQTCAIYDNLASKAPQSMQRTIERARNGSKTAAIKVNCARCVGFEDIAKQVRGCITHDCALWPFRPFQHATVEGEPIEANDANETGGEDE